MVKDQKFNFNIPLEVINKGDSEADWRIGGVASTEDKDFQGEMVKIDGLDISTLHKNGFFNEDHKKGFQNILGKIDFAEKRNNEEVGKHLYVEGKLFKTQPGAVAAWNLMKELGSGEKQMQLSVEGKIQKRTGKDRKIITKAKVENVALTLNPINDKTFASFLKSYQEIEDSEELEIREDLVQINLQKSTVDRLYELIDSKKNFKEHIYDLAKGMEDTERASFFRVLSKAKEVFDDKYKNRINSKIKNHSSYNYDSYKKMKGEGRTDDEIIDMWNRTEKSLTATHSYATQTPGERTGGDVMTQESLDRDKKKKKLKNVIWEARKSFPDVSVDRLCKMAFNSYEELIKKS